MTNGGDGEEGHAYTDDLLGNVGCEPRGRRRRRVRRRRSIESTKQRVEELGGAA